ncbi:MAG: hypothetical protein CMO80_10750 [Verrucomicrobiales bacterium]|nr:hypothetical protein [Verrucomicrobiales bacterium]|tara:strand:+ start:153 stop:593 length:441 start_codon:yes stop_codon:yes gene_type:complete
MKQVVLICSFLIGCMGVNLQAQSLSLRDSLAMIETGATSSRAGKWDLIRGSSGEVSRYQIMPEVWRKYTRSRSWSNPNIAWTVAKRILDERIKQFTRKVGRKPAPVEIYLLWNKPGHFAANKYKFYLVKRTYLQRAKRFANLMAET